MFLIYATKGQGGEELNPTCVAAAGGPKELWEIPEASHTGGIEARTVEYERRVVSFFDRALLGSSRSQIHVPLLVVGMVTRGPIGYHWRRSARERGPIMRRMLALTAIAAVVATSAALAASFPATIPLPNGWQPEGIAVGEGTTFYVGSIPTGAVYRGDLRTGRGSTLVAGAAGRAAIGVEHDRGRLFVAGGGTGKGFVYDARSGALVRELQLATGGGATFVNDVVVTRRAAWFTDSNRAALYRVPLSNSGVPAASAQVVPLTGDFQLVAGFNLNGIDATPDGKTLVVVQSATGKLFRVEPDGEDHRDRPRRGDGPERRRPAAPRPDPLRRPEPAESDRRRRARQGVRLGEDRADDHRLRLRRADDDRPARSVPVRGERALRDDARAVDHVLGREGVALTWAVALTRSAAPPRAGSGTPGSRAPGSRAARPHRPPRRSGRGRPTARPASRFAQLGVSRWSWMMFHPRSSPSAVPTTIAVSATNDDSSRKTAWIIVRRNPIARITPICCRRSTTARALMTPSAATPTTRPSAMKPWISRLNVRLAATASSTTPCIDCASRPFARKADSSRAAALSGSTPGAVVK